MEAAGFGPPSAEYAVVRLALSDYRATERPLGPGFRICGREARAQVCEEERRLLKLCFESWPIPFRGRLKGWREDSPIYLLREGRLVGGAYLCDRNEFDDDPLWGQLHYTFMDPSHRGLGLYSSIFRHAVAKAKDWRLHGFIVNSDREGLPEVYLRWGGVLWRTIPKPAGPGRRLARLARRLASGLVSRGSSWP